MSVAPYTTTMPFTNTLRDFNYSNTQTYGQLPHSNTSLNASFPSRGNADFTSSVVQPFNAPSHTNPNLVFGLPGSTYSTHDFTGELQPRAGERGPPRLDRSIRISSQEESAAGTQTSPNVITHTNHPTRRDTSRQVSNKSSCLFGYF